MSDMGTGKTLMSLSSVSQLFVADKIDRVVIVIRKALALNWVEHIEKYSNFSGMELLVYTAKSKRALLKTAQIIIVGYEMLRSRETEFDDIIDHRTCIVCDEASKLKGTTLRKVGGKWVVGSQITVVVKKLLDKHNPFFIFMTGTLISKTPLEAYNLLYMYYHGNYSHFMSFRATYCIMTKQKIIVGFRNLHRLEREIRKISVSLKMEDIVEMPELVTENRYIVLKANHRKLYDQYKKMGYIKVGDSLIEGGNALTDLLRGIQIASDPGILTGEWSDSKIESLREDLVEIGDNKVIIACHFVKTAERIMFKLKEWGYKAVDMYGGTKDKGSSEKAFRGDAQILVGHRQTIGYGLNLQFCHYLINYENWYDVEAHTQCLDRIRRPGQKHKMFIINYIAQDTVDKKVIDSIQEGIDLGKYLVQNNIGGRDFL